MLLVMICVSNVSIKVVYCLLLAYPLIMSDNLETDDCLQDFSTWMTVERREVVKKTGVIIVDWNPNTLRCMIVNEYIEPLTEEFQEIQFELEFGFHVQGECFFYCINSSENWMPIQEELFDSREELLVNLLTTINELDANIQKANAARFISSESNIEEMVVSTDEAFLTPAMVARITASGCDLIRSDKDYVSFFSDKVIRLLTPKGKVSRITNHLTITLGHGSGFYVSITDSLKVMPPIYERFTTLDESVVMAESLVLGLGDTLAGVIKEENIKTWDDIVKAETKVQIQQLADLEEELLNLPPYEYGPRDMDELD